VLEVVAVQAVETTTSISTSTALPGLPPVVSALVEEVDERAAIMEFDGNLDHETAERLAGEMLMGRNVFSPVAPAEPVGVDHVALAARLHPLVDAAVQRFGGTVRVISPEEDPFSTGWGVRAVSKRPENAVCPCGSESWEDVTLHDRDHAGQSVRRDCATCGKFIRHVRWYGKLCGPPDAAPPPSAIIGIPLEPVPVSDSLSFLPTGPFAAA
jgi:hypothetical protein